MDKSHFIPLRNVSKICILKSGFLLYSHWPWVTITEVNRDWDNLDKDSISHVQVTLVMFVRSLQLVILVSPVYFDELLYKLQAERNEVYGHSTSVPGAKILILIDYNLETIHI